MIIESYHIPVNFTDAGKIMGAFTIRNTVEAIIFTVPICVLTFISIPFDITSKIIGSLVLAVPIGGFALMGINDDSITTFIKTWIIYRRKIDTIIDSIDLLIIKVIFIK